MPLRICQPIKHTVEGIQCVCDRKNAQKMASKRIITSHYLQYESLRFSFIASSTENLKTGGPLPPEAKISLKPCHPAPVLSVQ